MSGLITQKMEIIKTDIEHQFSDLYSKKDFECELNNAKIAASDRRPQILKKLADMYRRVGIDCPYNQPFTYYEKLLSQLRVSEFIEDVHAKIVNMLCSLYTVYPKPETYMERIVNTLDPESATIPSLRLRILRRFLQNVNVRNNKKYYSKSLKSKIEAEGIDSIDETIFDALENPSEEKCDYIPLLKGCNQLANGIFISPAATQELLFLFAFAYDMRYYPTTASSNYDVARDVEKNLFMDYYSDNLTRFLTADNDPASGSSVKEPSGIGINLKNFVDVVFIYYLNQEQLTGSDKVTGFFTAIHEIKEQWKKKHNYTAESKKKYESTPTVSYQSWLDEAFFTQDTKAMIAFVLAYYYCEVRYTYVTGEADTPHVGSKGIFELSFATNTAYNQYKEILSLIEEATMRPIHDQQNEDSLQAHTAALADESFFSAIVGQDREVIADFKTVIANIEKRLNAKVALNVDDAQSVTRTKLISAYYHYFCAAIGDDASSENWRSFKDVYDEMTSPACVNDYLEKAGYQKISAPLLR